MNMNYKSKQDRQSFRNIMTEVDPENEQRAYYEDILEFF
jgi:hypothetical protein